MLDREQKGRIKELFSAGEKISEIARKVGVSRQSVYRVLDADVERDPEIIELEKDIRVAELRKRLGELQPEESEPMLKESEQVLVGIKSTLVGIKSAIDRLFSRVLALWYMSVDKNASQFCIYCGEVMERGEVKDQSGNIVPAYRCYRCNKVFPFP